MSLNLDKFYVIVDGSNIAFYKRTHNKKAKYKNLEIVKDYLQNLEIDLPIKWEIIVDASLRHRIDDNEKLELAIKKGEVIQSPNKAEADEFILEFYSRHPHKTIIISNDNFKEHSVSILIICKFVIMFDEIITHPNLEVILKSKIKSSKEAKINV